MFAHLCRRLPSAAALLGMGMGAGMSKLGGCESSRKIFDSKGDPYDGVSVQASCVAECETAEVFGARLDASLDAWKENGRRGIWLQ